MNAHRFAFAIAWGSCFPCAMHAASAIGQLESLTGQHISRPSIDGSAPAGFGGASSALAAFSMGLQLLDAFDAFSGPSQSDAVQVAMEQEHMRLLQEQRERSERLMTASRLRDFWDRQNMQSSATLGDILGAPVGGTAFFGIPGNPSSVPTPDPVSMPPGFSRTFVPAPATPAVSLPPQPVPAPIAAPASPAASPAMNAAPAEPPVPAMDRVQGAILAGKPWAKEYVGDVAKELVKRVVEALPARWNATMILEHGEKMNEFVGNVFAALEPKRLVSALVNGDSADVAAVLDDLDKVERRALGLGIADNPLEDEEMDTLANWMRGTKPELRELGGHLFNRARSYVVEKNVDFLLEGGF